MVGLLVSPFNDDFAFHIHRIFSTIASSKSRFDYDSFRRLCLTSSELTECCKLGIGSWADIFCAGRHCYVEEFLMGKSVTASGFCSFLGSLTNLPLVNAIYAYDMEDGTTVLLKCNNVIYMGEEMEDSLANPIQAEENNVRIDLRPQAFYPDQESAHTIQFPDGITIAILFDGVLPYIPVCRPLSEELDTCRRLSFTSRFA